MQKFHFSLSAAQKLSPRRMALTRRPLSAALALLVLSGLATGCVSAQKFNDLEAQHTKTQEELAAAMARVSELEAKLGIAREERTKLEGNVAEMHTALAELRERKAEAEKRLKEFRELTSKFRKLVDAGKLTVRIINGKMVLGLSSDILFPSGSAKLSPQGQGAIREVTALLKGLEGRHFQVEGHTDNIIHSYAMSR
jgi:flagellar motor protein MotB